MSLSRLRLALHAFWTWWIAELVDVAGTLGPSRSSGRPGTMRIRIQPPEITLLVVEADRREARIARLPCTADPATWGERLAAGRLHWHDAPSVEILLPPTAILGRSLQLPVAARARLRSALELQLERLLPLQADRVYFDARVLPGSPLPQQIKAGVAIVRRTLVDALVAAVGVDARVPVTVAGEVPDLGSFCFWTRRPQPTAARGRTLRRLALSAAGLAGVWVALIVYQAHQLDRQIAAALITTQRAADAAATRQATLDAAVKRLRFIADQQAEPDAAQALAEVTRRLPADAWVLQFQLEGRALRLEGFAPDASVAVAALAASPQVEKATLHSATKVGAGDIERFDIALTLKPETAS